MADLLKPEIRIETEEADYARVVAEPLEPGFGTTLGNALRRVLLAVAGDRGAPAEHVGDRVGRHSAAAHEHLVVAQRGADVVETADRPHAVAGQPDRGTGRPDRREDRGGVLERLARIEVDVERRAGDVRHSAPRTI